MTLTQLRSSRHLRGILDAIEATGEDQLGRPLDDPDAIRAGIPAWHPRLDGDDDADDDDADDDDADDADDDDADDDDANEGRQQRGRRQQQRQQRQRQSSGNDDDADDDDDDSGSLSATEAAALKRRLADSEKERKKLKRQQDRERRQQQEADGEWEQRAKDAEQKNEKIVKRIGEQARDSAIQSAAKRLRWKDLDTAVDLATARGRLPDDVVEVDPDDFSVEVDEGVIERVLKQLAKKNTDLVHPAERQQSGDAGRGDRTRDNGRSRRRGGGDDGYIVDPRTKMQRGYANSSR